MIYPLSTLIYGCIIVHSLNSHLMKRKQLRGVEINFYCKYRVWAQ